MMIKKRLLSMLVLLVTAVMGAVAQTTYKVSVKDGTEDAANWQGKAGTGDYQSLPLEGVAANTAVSAKYSGTKMVKSVKARKKAAALIVNPAVGQVIGSDGKNYAANATLPSGVTAVAKIVYVGDNCEAEPYNHGLALALSDASTGCEWSTSASSTVHTYNAKSPAFASESGLQYNATHNTDDYPAFKAAIANNGTAAPTRCSSWFLPSGYQWHQMTAEGYDYLGLGDNEYWTSTESDAAYAWYFSPEAAIGYPFTKDDNNKRVRSCLAF